MVKYAYEQPCKRTGVGDLSRKKLYLLFIGIVVLLAISISSAYWIMSDSAKPEKIVDKLERAVAKRDVDTVYRLLTSQDPVLELTEEHADALIRYFEDEEKVYRDEIDDLRSQLNGVRFRRSQTDILSLVEVGKKLNLFPDYKIAVQPFYFKIYTNQKDAEIHLDDEKILTAKSDYYSKVIGPLMPGKYEVEVSFESEYIPSLRTRETVVLPKQHNEEIDLSIKANYIYPQSNYGDAILYVNGRSTGQKINEIDRFGPVASDGSITLSAKLETDWGTFESEPLKLTEDERWPNLHIDGHEITVNSSFPEAHIYINGQDTGRTVEDTLYNGLGPFAGDELITLTGVYDSPWGELHSDEWTSKVEDMHGYAYLYFAGVPDSAKQEFVRSAQRFWAPAFDSAIHHDPGSLTGIVEDYRHEIYEQLPYFDFYHWNSVELLDATYGFDYSSMWVADGGVHMNAAVTLHYNKTMYDGWDDTSETFEQWVNYTLTMKYDEEKGEWLVSWIFPDYENYDYMYIDYIDRIVEYFE